MHASFRIVKNHALHYNNELMKGQGKKQKIYVAMSGGVDSSVAAALLKKKGYEVTGVFMRPWSRSVSSNSSTNRSRILDSRSESGQPPCLWKNDREDAMRVASKIGVPLLTWDFSREYKKHVADYMIREYKAGRTPNPDVMCNKEIKFGLFFKKALKEGADHIATGHYARTKKLNSGKHKLLKAKDKNKDQSYFLWTLAQEQLKHCLFPVGDYTKPEVRRLAKKFGLPTYAKKDSQGVCFVGPLEMGKFLKNYIKPKRGKILDGKDRLVGYHDGIFYYTIGQRHGLDIKDGKGPYYITRKDVKRNVICVGSKKDLNRGSLQVEDLSWVNKISLPRELDVRIRYRAKLSKAVVKNNGEIIFKEPETAITSGQSAVFYKGEELLGGGIIQ